jgi:hypothetical protein
MEKKVITNKNSPTKTHQLHDHHLRIDSVIIESNYFRCTYFCYRVDSFVCAFSSTTRHPG